MTKVVTNKVGRICFVLTGGGGDAGAFERALRIGLRNESELSIVGVVAEPPPALLRLLTSWSAATEELTGEAEQSAEVEQLVDVARQRNVAATGEIIRGPASSEVIRKVLHDKQTDMLIKAAEPSRGIQRVLFGHTDRQFIRECPCPVWIEKPSLGTSYDRVLAAVDPDPFRDDPDFDSVRDELNKLILEFALLLAEAENAELHVVHVWPFHLEGPLRNRAGLTEEAVAQAGKGIRQRHEQALNHLLRPFRRHSPRVHFIKGNAGEEISRLAADVMADVVVMGTMCRSGIGGLLIGNTAETVLDQIDCSLVALKPNGFVTPL